MNTRIKKSLVLWTKADICRIFGLSHDQLRMFVSEECKKMVGWKNKQQYFRDAQVLLILKDLKPALTDDERRELIGYKPILQINFSEKV